MMSDDRQWITRADGVRQRYAAASDTSPAPRATTPSLGAAEDPADIDERVARANEYLQRPAMGTPVHTWDNFSDAYDETQWNDNIKDGDVLIVRTSTGATTLGFLNQAWPIAVSGPPGSFHAVKAEYVEQLRAQYPEAYATIEALDPDHDPQREAKIRRIALRNALTMEFSMPDEGSANAAARGAWVVLNGDEQRFDDVLPLSGNPEQDRADLEHIAEGFTPPSPNRNPATATDPNNIDGDRVYSDNGIHGLRPGHLDDPDGDGIRQ